MYTSISLADDFLVEVDPLTFVKDGYSLHLRYHHDNFVYGAGIYSLDIPDFVTEVNSKNRNWEDRIDSAQVLFLDYLFDDKIDGWLVGLEITRQEHQLTYNSDMTNFRSIVYMLRGGYHYKPFSTSKFYLFPWAGVGYLDKVSGSPDIGTEKFDLGKITGFATLHIGFEF